MSTAWIIWRSARLSSRSAVSAGDGDACRARGDEERDAARARSRGDEPRRRRRMPAGR